MTSWVLRNTFFENQNDGQVLCTVSKFKASCAFENVGNRTKMDLVTLILMNAGDSSKIILLEFKS